MFFLFMFLKHRVNLLGLSECRKIGTSCSPIQQPITKLRILNFHDILPNQVFLTYFPKKIHQRFVHFFDAWTASFVLSKKTRQIIAGIFRFFLLVHNSSNFLWFLEIFEAKIKIYWLKSNFFLTFLDTIIQIIAWTFFDTF